MFAPIRRSSSRRVPVAVLMVAALALSACTHAPEHHFGGQVRGGQGFPKTNFGLSSAIPVKACNSNEKICVIDVGRASVEPKLDPQTFTYECGVSVPELILSPKGVQNLRWKLPDNTSDGPRFRFRSATQKVDVGGVSAYAKNATGFPFSPNRMSDTLFEFVHKSPDTKVAAGYAYGIYLEWAPAGTENWQVCTPLDPIIIEHN